MGRRDKQTRRAVLARGLGRRVPCGRRAWSPNRLRAAAPELPAIVDPNAQPRCILRGRPPLVIHRRGWRLCGLLRRQAATTSKGLPPSPASSRRRAGQPLGSANAAVLDTSPSTRAPSLQAQEPNDSDLPPFDPHASFSIGKSLADCQSGGGQVGGDADPELRLLSSTLPAPPSQPPACASALHDLQRSPSPSALKFRP